MEEQVRVFILDGSPELKQRDPKIHSIYKFLYWNTADGGIIIASITTNELHHEDIYNAATNFPETFPNRKPDGAGKCVCTGDIEYWKSEGLSVQTPEYLKPKIKAALGI